MRIMLAFLWNLKVISEYSIQKSKIENPKYFEDHLVFDTKVWRTLPSNNWFLWVSLKWL
jgi:hypothetical protein